MEISDRWLSKRKRLERNVVILNIFMLNIQFDTFRFLIEAREERANEREREKRSTVKFAYYYFLTFSMCHLHESEPFLSLYACKHTYVHRIELREHRSNSIVFDFCVISYLL